MSELELRKRMKSKKRITLKSILVTVYCRDLTLLVKILKMRYQSYFHCFIVPVKNPTDLLQSIIK